MTVPPPAYPTPTPVDTRTAPPMSTSGSKVSASWTGVLMAVGAIVAVVGTFLPFEKIILFQSGGAIGTITFTGVGSQTKTGQAIDGLKAGNAGKIILVLGVLALLAAILILAKKGRLWVGIVSLVLTAFALIMCFASLAAPKSDAKDLNAAAAEGYSAHALSRMGADLATVGVGITVLAAILAICLRRRRTV